MKGGAKGEEEVLTNGPSVTCGVGECGGVNFDANSYLQNSYPIRIVTCKIWFRYLRVLTHAWLRIARFLSTYGTGASAYLCFMVPNRVGTCVFWFRAHETKGKPETFRVLAAS
jgi:hypothetical protein